MKKFLPFILLFICSVLNAQTLLNGLEACYPLNFNANNFAATGSALNGTLTGVTAAVGHLGGANTAVQLSGSTQSYVELPNHYRLKGDSMTVSAWFYIDSLPNEQYLVYTKNHCSYNFESYSLITWYNNILGSQIFRVSKSNVNCQYAPQVDSGITPVIGNWYHVVFYIDESMISLYVNGVFQGLAFHQVQYDYDTTKSVFLGVTNESNFNLPFKGRIDDVRFYNRELTQTEVNQLYTGNPACSGSITTLSQEGNRNKDIRIFPNPSSGSFNVHNPSQTTLAFEVVNLIGEILKRGAIRESSSVEMDLSGMAPGIYFFRIPDNPGQQTIKLIKN